MVIFDTKQWRLRVLDNGPDQKKPKYASLAKALETEGCAAGVNGGYFAMDTFAPVGLMIAESSRTGSLNMDPWLHGILCVKQGAPHHVSLIPRENFTDDPAITQFLQSSPWIMQKGKITHAPGPSDFNTTSIRTFIAVDATGSVALGYCERATFYEIGALLASPATRKTFIAFDALNLDGGTSSAFCLRTGPKPISKPEMRPVRNFLGIEAIPVSPR